jgi:regulator of sigma E protease
MFDFLIGNDTLSAILAFIIVLIPAVLIHELGHFLAAKAVGITILEFGIGMPPRLIRLFRLHGTDYTLNWLPLGGFVRPLGEDIVRQRGDEEVNSDRDEALRRGIQNPKSVSEARPLQRIIFMAAGALANFLMAFVLFAIVGLSGLPTVTGARAVVQYVAPNSVFAQADLRPDDVIEAVNGQPLLTGASLLESIAAAETEQVTLTVIRHRESAPLEIVVPRAAAAGPVETRPFVRGVAVGSPAASAGIEPGDFVLALNDFDLTSYTQLQARTREFLDREVTLVLWRGGQELTVTLTPRSNPPEGQGAMGVEIGNGAIAPAAGLAVYEGPMRVELVPLSFGEAMQYSVARIGGVFNTILSVPAQILQGTAQPEQLRLTSPLGISQVGAVFLQDSIEQRQPAILLEFMALISIALGFTNLLPIPALDGGRILFVLIEIIRGRPIAPEREGMVHFIGVILLLSLMVVVLLNDIRDPLTNLIR